MAVPNPEDELTRLTKAVARGLPPLLIVTGASDFFRAQAMERVLAAVPPGAELRVVEAVDVSEVRGGGDEVDLDDGDGDGDDGEGQSGGDGAQGLAACPELLDLRGGGLFVKTAFVVVRRGSGWWTRHVDTLAQQLPKFAAGCGLVLDAAKLDKRKKVAQTLVKSVEQSGALYQFRDLYDMPFDRSRGPFDGELCKWVVARSRRLGVALQPDAAWLVVSQVGTVPAELFAELQRLRDRLGADEKRAPLKPADLRGKLTTSFESTPFEFAEAVLGGDRRAAFRSVRAMFDRGVRNKDGGKMDPGGLLPFTTSWLYRQLAQTLEGRQLLDDGVSPRDVAERAGVRWFGERFVEQVKRHDQAALRRGLLALHACQRASRDTGEAPDVLIERFLAMWFDGVPVPTAAEFDA